MRELPGRKRLVASKCGRDALFLCPAHVSDSGLGYTSLVLYDLSDA
jgi:hypothetical protein